MKKLCFLVALLLGSNSSSAQVNLDSLWNVWNDKTLADTVRLEAVYYFIHDGPNNYFYNRNFFVQNTDSLLALIKLVEEVTEASGNKKYKLMALQQKGDYFKMVKKPQEAVKLYGQALEMARTMQDKRLILMSTVVLANGEYAWGMSNGSQDTARLAQAEKRFLEAIKLLELESFDFDKASAKPDPQLSSYAFVTLFQLGNLKNSQNNFSLVIQYLEKAVIVAERSGNKFHESAAWNTLGTYSYIQGNYPSAVHYSKKALIIADELLVKLSKAGFMPGAKERSRVSLLAGQILGNLGNSYNKMGNHIMAIKNLKSTLSFSEADGNKDNIARMLNNIASIYKNNRDVETALSYYEQSTKIAEEIESNYVIVANLTNTGNIYKDRGEYKTALEKINRAIKINTEEKLWPSGLLSIEIGAVYMEMKDYAKANEHFNQATENLESIGAKGEIITIMSYQCRMFSEQGNFAQAISLGEKGLKMAEEVGMITIQKDFSHNLYEANKSLKRGNKALEYHERYLLLSDSLKAEETGKILQQMEFQKEMLADSLVQAEETRNVEMAHQEEVRKKDRTKNIYMGSGFLLLLMGGGLFSRLRYVRKSKAVLQVEKDRSENLLLNILPAEVAEELKLNGKALARDFDRVSIIFTDFKGFTESSEKVSAGELVGELNHCFEGFDAIMEKYGIEKIKTIGDAYMAAGGLPVSNDDSTVNTVKAALEMQQFMSARKKEQDATGKMAFEMRAGIHTGPVVAGIVGVKKFQYDIWGDTVNTASRMESNGEVGQVNISQDTYELIKDDAKFTFNKRGKIQAKGKGEMEMYFVN